MTNNSIQELADPWWIVDDKKDFRRGRLVRVFIPHVNKIPKTLEITGRNEPTCHNKIDYITKPLRINSPPKLPPTPAAAFPVFDKEVLAVYNAKKRPAIIICGGGDDVPKILTRGKPKWQSDTTILVAPCYGADEDEKRSGIKPEFIERIYACQFPQFIADKLPIGGASESVIRLDHLQPVGKHHDSVEFTPHCLSETALDIVDSWLDWLITGEMDEDSLLSFFREERKEI
ncbi:MAG: hypothetical protein KJ737_06555 [Proteobacteria bacterium]|nr:hypothetical protein [Pseudomonadota bacterium]